jgi:hypothetical protein
LGACIRRDEYIHGQKEPRDIDDEHDFLIAALLLEHRLKNGQ